MFTGTTGGGKSEAAATPLRHFAPRLGARNPPASWHDTPTDLEAKLAAMADAIFVIDEMEPTNDRMLRRRREGTMSTILQCVGNHSGRGRSNVELGSRAVRRPRIGVLISTSEYVNLGTSTMARTLRVDIPLGHVDRAVGVELREAGEDGLLAEALSHVIRVMAHDRNRILEPFAARRREFRIKAEAELAGVHGRTVEPVADLMAAFSLVPAVLGEDVLPPGVGDEFIWKNLVAAGQEQRTHLRAADPAPLFFDTLQAAIASGEAYLSPVQRPEDSPPEPHEDAWGWRRIRDEYYDPKRGEDVPAKWAPQGRRIGYADDDRGEAYLIGPAAYAVAERMAGAQERSLAIGERQLYTLLRQRNLIVRADPGRNTLKQRIGRGDPQNVICVRLRLLVGSMEGAGDQKPREPSGAPIVDEVDEGRPFEPWGEL